MAVLWETHLEGVHYEVRTAGNTVRLYTNGVFHSQYNPKHVFSGAIWDLMSLPLLLKPIGAIKRILVLGVGGGTILHQFHYLNPNMDMVGIEINATHIMIANKFFGLSLPNIQLIQSDAIQWVKKVSKMKQGPKFDLIVDDIYGEDSEGNPQRIALASSTWCQSLLELLNPGGLILMNFTDPPSYENCAFLNTDKRDKRIQSGLSLKTPAYENRILVFSEEVLSTQKFRHQLRQHSVIAKHIKSGQLKIKISTLL